MIEPAQYQDLAPRQQRRIELEARVLGGRPDEGHRAVLDKREETVLLGAVEAMDFVHEEERVLARLGGRLSLGEDLFQIGHTGEHCRDRHEAHSHRVRQ